MLRVAFVGALSSSFADRVRAHLTIPCDFIHTDEKNASDVLPEIDVLVTLVFTPRDGRGGHAAPAHPGSGRRAGPDRPLRDAARRVARQGSRARDGHRRVRARRHDRAQPGLRSGAREPSRRPLGQPVGARRAAAARVARARRTDARHPWLRRHRPGTGPACPRVRHARLRDPPQRRAIGGRRPGLAGRYGESARDAPSAPTTSPSPCRSRRRRRGSSVRRSSGS